MVRKLMLLHIIILFVSCSTSKKIVTRTITQNFTDLNITPTKQTKEIRKNLQLSVIPIDAIDLNIETYNAAERDGNYQKESIQYYESLKSQLNSVPKNQKSKFEGKINAFDCLNRLETEGKIPANFANRLKQRIYSDNSGRDGTEIDLLSDKFSGFSEFNPYKLNENYFSVIKLQFQNEGKEVEKISLKDFQLASNEEQLYPLNTDYFEKNIDNRSERMKNAYRMNMPNELLITPSQKVVKYLAVPALNTLNSQLSIQYIENNKFQNFDFNISRNIQSKTFVMEQYVLGFESKKAVGTYHVYYAVGFPNGVVFTLKDDKLFLDENKKNELINIYAIGIEVNNGNIIFGSAQNIIFASEKKHAKVISMGKIKREK